MKLSVIIVSYNVKHYLEYCLLSLSDAASGIEHEIIIVDNASTDNTLNDLKNKLPGITWISNIANKGFGSACNQGAKIASGEFLLFLNPDTLVTQPAIEKTMSFLNDEKKGIAGVRMIDGEGKFLPESTRSNPATLSSIFKVCGLASLFPSSKLFNHYALCHIPERAIVPADILFGAFMIMKNSLFKTIHGFDEDFFLYGEDINLCYRVKQAGFQN